MTVPFYDGYANVCFDLQTSKNCMKRVCKGQQLSSHNAVQGGSQFEGVSSFDSKYVNWLISSFLYNYIYNYNFFCNYIKVTYVMCKQNHLTPKKAEKVPIVF